MKANSYENEINSIIQEIEATNKLIITFKKDKDIINSIVVKQFIRKKKNLLKELLSALLQSNLNVIHYERLYQEILNYLKKEESKTNVSSDFIKNIHRAESLLVV